MSKAAVHRVAGVACGGVVALYHAEQENGLSRLLETLGGMFGGYHGSKGPDLVDPPNHPNHRGIGHGALPIAAIGVCAHSKALELQSFLRETATWHEQKAAAAANDALRLLHTLVAIALRFISGMAVGLLAGYASHLCLDATTTRGLPLVK